MDFWASLQTVFREPLFFFQCSCSQNDELLAFSSTSASNHFSTTRTPYDTNQNGTYGLLRIHKNYDSKAFTVLPMLVFTERRIPTSFSSTPPSINIFGRLSAGRLNGFSGDAQGDKESINPACRFKLPLGYSWLLDFFWFAVSLHWFSNVFITRSSSSLEFFESS